MPTSRSPTVTDSPACRPARKSSRPGNLTTYVLQLVSICDPPSLGRDLAWLVLTAGLHHVAPRWEQVTKDDDVRFFPADSLSVIGQDLLERGFPADASSSQLVLVYERKHGHVTPDDLRYIEDVATKLYEFGQSHPELGIKKLDRHSTPVIGPRLIGTSADGQGQAVLTIVRLDGTHVSKKTRIAVDRILEWLKTELPAAPAGLELAVTGSAVVGHDTNRAAGESIQQHDVQHDHPGRGDLAGRLPVAAAGDGPAGHDRTLRFRLAAADRAAHQRAGPRVSGHQHHPGFHHRRPLWRGDRLLPVPDRSVLRGVGRGRSRIAALDEAIRQVGTALVASAGTVIIGLGMLYFSSFAKVKYTGPTIALSLTVALLAALTLAPALLVIFRGAIFWPFRARIASAAGPDSGLDDDESRVMAGFWVRVADLVVAYPLLILAVCLVVLVPLAVVGARTKSNHNQLSDLDPDRPSVIGANAVRRYFAVGELSPAVALVDNPRLDFRSPRDAGRSTRSIAACRRSTTSPKSVR